MNDLRKQLLDVLEESKKPSNSEKFSGISEIVNFYGCKPVEVTIKQCNEFLLQNNLSQLSREVRIIRASKILELKDCMEHILELQDDLKFLGMKQDIIFQRAMENLNRASTFDRIINLSEKCKRLNIQKLDDSIHKITKNLILGKLSGNVDIDKSVNYFIQYLSTKYYELSIAENCLKNIMKKYKLSSLKDISENYLSTIQSIIKSDNIMNEPVLQELKTMRIDSVWVFTKKVPSFAQKIITFENLDATEMKSIEREAMWIKSHKNYKGLITIEEFDIIKNQGKLIMSLSTEVKSLNDELQNRKIMKDYFSKSEFSHIMSQVGEISKYLASENIKQVLRSSDFVIDYSTLNLQLFRVDLQGQNSDLTLLTSQLKYLKNFNN